MFLAITAQPQYLWRAVNQHGSVLDTLAQRVRNKAAAKKFFRKLLKGYTYVPPVMITDKLASYSTAKRKILPSVEHRQRRSLRNRSETSHQLTRKRERVMQRLSITRFRGHLKSPTIGNTRCDDVNT